MFITHKNNRIEVEQIKSAHTSCGFVIYLFRICPKQSFAFTNAYIVAVKDSSKNTVEYKNIPLLPGNKSLQIAIQYYMDYLLCYC